MQIIYILVSILIALCILYIYLIAPKKNDDIRKYLNVSYAHRGLHSGKTVPENSMQSFKLAIEKNYAIELDVDITKDKVPVVFHDDNTLRITGIDKNLRDITAKELSQHQLFDTEEKVPLFEEFLSFINDQAILYIEIKDFSFDIHDVCFAVNEKVQNYKGRYMIFSFNPLVLHWFKKNAPHVKRGLIVQCYKGETLPGWQKFGLEHMLLNFLARPHAISVDYNYKNFGFSLVRKLFKVPTLVWTIDSISLYAQYKEKYDTVVFENITP